MAKLGYLKAALVTVYVIIVVSVIGFFVLNGSTPVLTPQGSIADQQRSLLIFASILMLFIVVPVFALTFGIAWKYRAGNKKAHRDANWDHHKGLEAVWWGFPLIIIAILAVVTWTSSHALDPFKPIEADKKPLTIQVVAMSWKWLFIYPEQNIAVVNEVRIPEKTPINFVITSDAPMNSFWIPSLGGQIYAMTGMSSRLHLIADKTGTYRGVSANLSGEGHADMKFNAISVSETDFANWAQKVRKDSSPMNVDAYNELSKLSRGNKVTYYSLQEPRLYDMIVGKYMSSHGGESKSEGRH